MIGAAGHKSLLSAANPLLPDGWVFRVSTLPVMVRSVKQPFHSLVFVALLSVTQAWVQVLVLQVWLQPEPVQVQFFGLDVE
jgi:hypothetical protein